MAAGGAPTSMMQMSSGSIGGQTVPAGPQSNNPMGNSVFSNLSAASPVAATLPNYPGLNVNQPGGLSGSVPTTNPAGFSGTAQTGQDFSVTGDFQQTYGRGTGTEIASELGGLGTQYSEALNMMDTATINAAQKQYGNVKAQMAAAGVDPGSSAAALMSSDFSSHLTDTLSSNAAQLGLQEEQMKLGGLTGEGQAHGSDVSGWDQFGSVMQSIGGAAAGLGEAYFTGGGSLSGMLGGLGGLFGGGHGPSASAAGEGTGHGQ